MTERGDGGGGGGVSNLQFLKIWNHFSHHEIVFLNSFGELHT